MSNVRIISDGDFTTPIAVQNAIKNKFALSKEKEITVKHYPRYNYCYDIHNSKGEYISSFNEIGNEM